MPRSVASSAESVRAGSLPDVAVPVVAYDPFNKAKYDLEFGGPNSNVLFTRGLTTFLQQRHQSGNKRVFLCKKYQASTCIGDVNCTSIHASKATVQHLRTLFPRQPDFTVFTYFEAKQMLCNVPLNYTLPTVGRNLGSGVLCQQHADTRTCGAGDQCPRIHVAPSRLAAISKSWDAPCCGNGACPTATWVHAKQPRAEFATFVVANSQQKQTPRDRLSYTQGLEELADGRGCGGAGSCLEVPWARICRPHLRQECKWQDECKNVHVCRHTFSEITSLAHRRARLTLDEVAVVGQVAPRGGVDPVEAVVGAIELPRDVLQLLPEETLAKVNAAQCCCVDDADDDLPPLGKDTCDESDDDDDATDTCTASETRSDAQPFDVPVMPAAKPAPQQQQRQPPPAMLCPQLPACVQYAAIANPYAVNPALAAMLSALAGGMASGAAAFSRPQPQQPSLLVPTFERSQVPCLPLPQKQPQFHVPQLKSSLVLS
ncbi:hypothetical protein DIPPA_05153 [Diplonema papillatum]|nr:hypothetical protein DIPPA_05153 [Diplonema papillatum]